MAGLGVLAGLLGAAVASQLLESLVVGVGVRDLLVFAVAGGLVGGVGFVAGCIPAFRVTRDNALLLLKPRR
jgi:hypothetical protein